MDEKYYGILMKKIEIYENVAIYIPKRIISGVVSKAVGEDDSVNVFVEEGYGKEYILMNDLKSILPPDDEVIGYEITEEDLIKESNGLSLEQSKIEYFDRMSETVKVGFYVPEKFENKIIFIDLDLEGLKFEFSEAETDLNGNINISYYDAVATLIDMYSFDDFVKIDEKELLEESSEEEIEFERISLDDDEVKNESTNEIKEKVITKYLKEKEEQNDEDETFEMLLDKLKLLSPSRLIKFNDMDIIKEKKLCIESICDKMNEKIENSLLDKASKQQVLKFIQSIKCYYGDKIEISSNIDDVKMLLECFGFVYDKELELLEKYYEVFVKEKITNKQVQKEEKKNKQQGSEKPFSIKEVKMACDKRVIGQEAAKEAVISAIYMNRKNAHHLTKNVLLLVGPTGSGKTLIAETVADCLDIPSVSIDTTQLTIAGYKGADIESYLATLITRADGDIEKAEHGIVILDEFDKKGSENNSDVSGKGVLNSLLPFIQGTLYKVSMGKGSLEKTVDFNTDNLTVLVAGSCNDAIKAVEKEQNKILGFKAPAGEGKTKQSYYKITKEGIEKYCQIPEEFMGRISNVVQLQPHTKDTIRQIILESDISPLLSEKEKLSEDGIDLLWNDGYIEKLGEKALADTHGVRALKELIETSIMLARWKALYEEDTFKEIILNEKSVDEPDETILVYNDGNYTTVRNLKENTEKSKVKEKSNDVK